MASSTVAQLVSYPLALIRTRLQAQGAHGKPVKYKGMVDVAVQTVRAAHDRFDLAEGGEWFMESELLLQDPLPPLGTYVSQPPTKPTNPTNRTRETGISHQPLSLPPHSQVQREGLYGLYKGLVPNLFKLAPAAGISWYVFEETKLLLGVDPRS